MALTSPHFFFSSHFPPPLFLFLSHGSHWPVHLLSVFTWKWTTILSALHQLSHFYFQHLSLPDIRVWIVNFVSLSLSLSFSWVFCRYSSETIQQVNWYLSFWSNAVALVINCLLPTDWWRKHLKSRSMYSINARDVFVLPLKMLSFSVPHDLQVYQWQETSLSSFKMSPVKANGHSKLPFSFDCNVQVSVCIDPSRAREHIAPIKG